MDGYNFTGIDHGDLAAEREKLVNLLVGYKKIKGHDITVVFDGWKSGGYKEVSSVTGGIRVIYSRLGETADSVIKRIIQKEKRQWIVITSDRDIAGCAWSQGNVAVPADQFRAVLGKASAPVPGEYEPLDADEYYVSPERKGNPRKPSKKEKALMRALKKL